MNNISNGLLFTSDFLNEGIRQTLGWNASENDFIIFRDEIKKIFSAANNNAVLNEAQTEDEFILPVLKALGWNAFLRQQTANSKGREDVPDFLLFGSDDAKTRALAESQPNKRYMHGIAIIEAKKWSRPLDRGESSDVLDPGTPSSQMLRYLSRVEVASDRKIKWGMLTNGKVWRLYWQDARSRSEDFLQFDLLALSEVASVNQDIFASVAPSANVHLLRAFFLLFRRTAFLPQAGDSEHRSFHAIALDEGKLWETRVSQDLGTRVFEEIFPKLTASIALNDKQAVRPYSREYLEEVHRATLILLYRLLFVLYAEDRDLLPVHDNRYDDYSLRSLRNDIAKRTDQGDTFSSTATRAWQHLRSLFRAIDKGDDSMGLPPYNGGLFHETPTQLIARIELPDAELAPIIDGLSRRPDISGLAFINYRDLAVQHLGSIYERLLEQRLIEAENGGTKIKPSPFARKNSGSYYTHDDLVKLILKETITPLQEERIALFDAALVRAKKELKTHTVEQCAQLITQHDPAEALLKLKVCDPAMGSGHFLVTLVDDLADRVLEQLADAPVKAKIAGIEHYQSPITLEIARLRGRILLRAQECKWAFDPALLDDRHLVRRMILKRVVHGADKNAMAVELAKLALWLHTFTVGAPLSFLDHHLRCGDSLYGERIATVRSSLAKLGNLFNDSQVSGLINAAQTLTEINTINDIDLQEVERSRNLMEQAFELLDGLKRAMDIWHAIRWIAPLDAPKKLRTEKHRAATELFSGRYNRTLMEMLTGDAKLLSDDPLVDDGVNALLDECRALAKSEGFLHWELAFPSVWQGLNNTITQGGFDAIIGNPPWDRMKLQEVEWFAERKPEIALKSRAADRKKMIEDLRRNQDQLYADYLLASKRAEDGSRVARDCGEYPLLSNGDINLYSLFVERSAMLVADNGVVGLLTPSGISGDKGAAEFFRGLSTTGRLGALFDFENKQVFFPDVDSRFKFSAIVFGGKQRRFEKTRCAFYLHSIAAIDEADRMIELSAEDFAAVNPNTGTAPIFRSRRDAELTTRIYRENPVLVKYDSVTEPNKKTGEMETKVVAEHRLYPVRYCTMFHMTSDSGLFKRRDELEAEGWYPIGGSRYKRGVEEMLPLYVGRMIYHYDHRASSVTINEENIHNAALSINTSEADKKNPSWSPTPQYWVPSSCEYLVDRPMYTIAFRDIARATDARTVISSIIPSCAAGNTLPLVLFNELDGKHLASNTAQLLANLCCFALDYIARQKVQSTHLNWYIAEQLPFISPVRFDDSLGTGTIAELICREVLHLSYTAHDLQSFARDLGYEGEPFVWDAEDRRHRMARLDALFFQLYGLNRDEAAYIMDTFPIVKADDEKQFGRYRTKELILGYMNALAAGDIDSVLAI